MNVKESVLNEICKYDVCFSRQSPSFQETWLGSRLPPCHTYFMVIDTMSKVLARESRYYAESTKSIQGESIQRASDCHNPS